MEDRAQTEEQILRRLEESGEELARFLGDLRRSPAEKVPPSGDLTFSLKAVNKQIETAEQVIADLKRLLGRLMEWDFAGPRMACEFALRAMERDRLYLLVFRETFQKPGQESGA